jgi:hypothetical protein
MDPPNAKRDACTVCPSKVPNLINKDLMLTVDLPILECIDDRRFVQDLLRWDRSVFVRDTQFQEAHFICRKESGLEFARQIGADEEARKTDRNSCKEVSALSFPLGKRLCLLRRPSIRKRNCHWA